MVSPKYSIVIWFDPWNRVWLFSTMLNDDVSPLAAGETPAPVG